MVWGITDIYHYFAIGQEVLLHYDGMDVIAELVRYDLTQGIVKFVICLSLLLLGLIRNRHRK